MNLHGIVSGQIEAVNPFETVALSTSLPARQNADGSRTPLYSTEPVTVQVQALTGKDLRQVEQINLQGTLRKFYFYGDVEGIVRSLKRGGDLITRSDSSEWLVTMVMETWPDWCAVIGTLQNGE